MYTLQYSKSIAKRHIQQNPKATKEEITKILSKGPEFLIAPSIENLDQWKLESFILSSEKLPSKQYQEGLKELLQEIEPASLAKTLTSYAQDLQQEGPQPVLFCLMHHKNAEHALPILVEHLGNELQTVLSSPYLQTGTNLFEHMVERASTGSCSGFLNSEIAQNGVAALTLKTVEDRFTIPQNLSRAWELIKTKFRDYAPA